MASRTSGEELRSAALWRSSGTITRYAMPVAMQMTAGIRNAPRQPTHAVSIAVMPAANATPRLPHTPFNASVRPRFTASDTTIAVPTG